MSVAVELRSFHGAVMREVMSRLSATIQPHRLSPAQVSALFRLRGSAGMTVSAIGAQLGLTSGTTSHLVEQLVRRGVVVRRDDAADRRQRQVCLTPAGRALLTRIDHQLDEALAALLAPVPAGAVEALVAALAAVLPHLSDPGT